MFSRTHPAERVVGARAQINKDIVDHAHHVLIAAEGGHDVFVGGIHILSAACHHAEEVAIAHRLEQIRQRRRIRGAIAIRPVADVAFGMVADVARVGVPIDGAVGLSAVRWVAVFVEILAVLILDSGRIPRPVSQSDAGPKQRGGQRECGPTRGRFQ